MCQVIISFSKAEKKPDSVNFLLATEIGRYDRSVRILFNHIISLLWVMRPTTCLLAASTWRTWGELETSQTSNRRLPPSMRARVRSSPLSRFLDGETDAVGRFVGLRPKLHESFDARSARLSLSLSLSLSRCCAVCLSNLRIPRFARSLHRWQESATM